MEFLLAERDKMIARLFGHINDVYRPTLKAMEEYGITARGGIVRDLPLEAMDGFTEL